MIDSRTTLVDVCFIVCTALDEAGVVAVLCGGSAATFYAPSAYQSQDADFVILAHGRGQDGAAAMQRLGYVEKGGIYSHPKNSFTVEFPAGPLGVGDELISRWITVERGNQRLHVVSRTDCVRDRLSHFYNWRDRSALEAAVAVAVANISDVDLGLIRDWTEREDPKLLEKFAEFERRLQRGH